MPLSQLQNINGLSDVTRAVETFATTAELVGITLENFSTPPFQETLANCARVNRVFSYEALRILWRELHGLNPFLCLFPEEVVPSLRLKLFGESTDYSLIPSDWDKAFSYATLVRKIELLSSSSRSPSSSIAGVFRETFPARNFFPNLRHFVLAGELTKLTIPLLSPSIRTININAYYLEASDTPIFIQAIQSMTSLEVLRLSTSQVDVYNNMANIVSGKEGLRELSLGGASITWEQLHSLRSLSNLRYLAIRNMDIKIPEIVPRYSHLFLPQLREFMAHGEARVLTWLIGNVQLKPQRAITIQLHRPSSSKEHFAMLFEILGSLSAPTLQELQVHDCACGEPPKDQITSISLDFLQPILRLNNMRRLIIDLGVPADISDNDIPGLMRALPNLQEIRLQGELRWVASAHQPRLSPCSLFYFAKEAPQLQHLGVQLNSNWQDLGDLLPPSFHSSSRLDTLNILNSKPEVYIENAYPKIDIATMLCKIFPRLRNLNFDHMDAIGHRHFKQVDAELREIALEWQEIQGDILDIQLDGRVYYRSSSRRRA